METTLGGERLGAGKKEKIHLKNYERSTHDLSYIWRSTMATGTLVPFINEVTLPGDTFEIKLDASVLTLPTIGPLFGSYKLQLDVFSIPMRLYNSGLHMNRLGIGLKMQEVKLPQLELYANNIKPGSNLETAQVNPSCILSYLGIRGIGNTENDTEIGFRYFNAIPYLGYWDIYKNYYANKQEEIGMVIHADETNLDYTIDRVKWYTNNNSTGIEEFNVNNDERGVGIFDNSYMTINYTGTYTETDWSRFKITVNSGNFEVSITEFFSNVIINENDGIITFNTRIGSSGFFNTKGYIFNREQDFDGSPKIKSFPLKNIDDMRYDILRSPYNETYELKYNSIEPYNLALERWPSEDKYFFSATYKMEGLGLKTYQSDLFNNWLNTEWIDGDSGIGGINNITKISVTDGSFTINELNLAKKIYDMLNRIAVSGGSYDDWLDATYTHERIRSIENPIYMGGLSKEIVFQEVVSNSVSEGNPLGTLAGRGVLSNKHKGGYVKIKTDEPSIIMGIVSITPRIDYSQGNKWHMNLRTMDDFHKPALDGIGFQSLLVDNMAYWQTRTQGYNYYSTEAGKQPAWINYMTNVNQVYGNFAIQSEQMYMTLNRRYEAGWKEGNSRPYVKDLTTYIDPSKYNTVFADTRLDAQNFWVQLKVDIEARRKMSAKIIPNL